MTDSPVSEDEWVSTERQLEEFESEIRQQMFILYEVGYEERLNSRFEEMHRLFSEKDLLLIRTHTGDNPYLSADEKRMVNEYIPEEQQLDMRGLLIARHSSSTTLVPIKPKDPQCVIEIMQRVDHCGFIGCIDSISIEKAAPNSLISLIHIFDNTESG